MLRDKKIVGVVITVGVSAVVVLLLLLFRQQQRLEQQLGEREQTAADLAAAGTAQAGNGTAQAASGTAFAVRVTAGAQGTAAAQTAQAATAAAKARASATAQAALATAQARVSATAQAVYSERRLALTTGTILNAGELTTAILPVEEAVEVEQANDNVLGVFNIRPTKLSYTAHVDVRAGFDLRAMTKDNVSITGNRVTIYLPPPVILVSTIDPARSKVYEENVPWFGILRSETLERAQRLVLKDALTAACSGRLLEQANQNATETFEKLLFALDFSQVMVISQPGRGCE